MQQVSGFIPNIEQLLENAGKLLEFAAKATDDATRDALADCAADLVRLAVERSRLN